MKNKHIEKLIQKSKQYAKTAKNDSRWDHKLGIKVYHYYDPANLKPYAWWDDLAFFVGSQQMTVWFVHPRMAYHDHIDNVVHESLPKLGFDYKDFMSDSTPNYKYLGKNKKRKRVVSWSLHGLGKNSEYYDNWRKQTEELCKTSDYEQGCSIQIKQYGYCRGVELVVPIEAVDESGLVQLKEIVLNHLKDPTYFQRTFGDYKYTSVDWVKEGHNNESRHNT